MGARLPRLLAAGRGQTRRMSEHERPSGDWDNDLRANVNAASDERPMPRLAPFDAEGERGNPAPVDPNAASRDAEEHGRSLTGS